MEVNNNLDKLKGRTPFHVPDGYFENFTENMANRLPDVSEERPRVISIYDRVKPWLYMAAVFAGLIVLFNVINKTASGEDPRPSEKTALPALSPNPESEVEANDEFLEYIEDMYADKYALSYVYDFMDN
jgi:hypothetical protein